MAAHGRSVADSRSRLRRSSPPGPSAGIADERGADEMVARPAEKMDPREAATIAGRVCGAEGAAEERESGVLLTGATGFVGMELLARYLERTDRRVYALVRGADDHAVAARVARTLRFLFGEDHAYGDRVIPIRGDMTRPGLDVHEGSLLAERVTEIVHGAA